MGNVRESALKIKTSLPLLTSEPMAEHTTFRIGGPADVFARPVSAKEALELCRYCVCEGLPFFVLGGGANILVSDRGIRGMVIDTSRMAGIEREGEALWAEGGAPISAVASRAADCSLSGLEFIYAMPGSVGGAIWMNARCYAASVSDVLDEAEYVDCREPVAMRREKADPARFSYKVSPFQSVPCLITRARFTLRAGERASSLSEMEAHRADRLAKGHFRHPSAGSAFKNDRAFGEPTGKIIDSLGLKGFAVGGAAVSEDHGNIVVNRAGARAADVLRLLREVERRVLEARGLRLEREILLVGEWDRNE